MNKLTIEYKVLFPRPDLDLSGQQYDDAFCPAVDQGSAPLPFKCAIADGAWITREAGVWARHLVEAFVLADWDVDAVHKSWSARQDQISNRKPTMSLAAFVGLSLKHCDGDKGTWQSLAIGDSCLVQFRNNRIVESFPLLLSYDFSRSPELLASASSINDYHIRRTTGEFHAGDVFLLMTDGFGKFLLANFERGEYITEILTMKPPALWTWVLDTCLKHRKGSKHPYDASLIKVTVGVGPQYGQHRMTNKITAAAVALLLASWAVASTAPAFAEKPSSAVTNAASGSEFDMSEYRMQGVNGGRGGLPEVRLWFTKSHMDERGKGEHGWSYPSSARPDNMHYSSWIFWQCSVSDALLQLVSEQATDPARAVPHLGPFFGRLKNTGVMTGWSKEDAPPKGLELDISDTVHRTESVDSPHYGTYGISNRLFFQGEARFLLTVDNHQHLSVALISSTLPPEDTRHLQSGLESLSGHALFSFPEKPNELAASDWKEPDKIQFVAEFILKRQPGELKPAG